MAVDAGGGGASSTTAAAPTHTPAASLSAPSAPLMPPTTSTAATAAAPVPAATGGAAILARLRAQRASAAKPAAAAVDKSAPPLVTFVYASQTGTSQEIAKTLQAEALQKGFRAQTLSFNELGWANISAAATPILVLVTSSTGDGDPPDNGSTAWAHMLRTYPEGHLKGVRFTSLGLGDSNYTSYMRVPRRYRQRLAELGASPFFKFAEADEVEGIENIAEPWTEELWPALKIAVADVISGKPPPDSVSGIPKDSSKIPVATNGVNSSAAVTAASANGTATVPSKVTASSESSQTAAGKEASGHLSGVTWPVVPPVALGADTASPTAPVPSDPTTATSASTTATADTSAAKPASQAADALEAAMPALVFDDTFPPPRHVEVVPILPDAQLGLVDGLAPEAADLSGAPPLAPCRVRIVWLEDAAMQAQAQAAEAACVTGPRGRQEAPQGGFTALQPFWAPITHARCETASWSDRKVLHQAFGLEGSGISYGPGDSVGVLPSNDPQLVAQLCKHMGLDPSAVFTVEPLTPGPALLQHLPRPCTLRHAFTHALDLTSAPKKSLLRVLAEHASDPAHRRTLLFLISKAGRDAYQHEILQHSPSLLDLLQRFPSCKPPLDALLDALPPLQPRMYSVCSSPLHVGEAVEVALSVVRFDTRYGRRNGVASSWLECAVGPLLSKTAAGKVDAQSSSSTSSATGSTAQGSASSPQATTALVDGPPSAPPALSQTPAVRVPLFWRRGGDFKPPPDLATPMIMIGPGTGVAPFRGFLQHRAHLARGSEASDVAHSTASSSTVPNATGGTHDTSVSPGAAAKMQLTTSAPVPGLGDSVLYFGCRRAEEDYLYRSELEGMVADGTLTKLRVAFSRAQAEKEYVQHLLHADAPQLYKLIQAGAHIYVCGDGARMVKDVHNALLYILKSQSGVDEAAATAQLAALAQSHRYVRDVWSA